MLNTGFEPENTDVYFFLQTHQVEDYFLQIIKPLSLKYPSELGKVIIYCNLT